MRIFAIGRNYAEHIRELNNERPDEPVIFTKPDTAVLRNNAPFYYPDFSKDIHYEVELVLRVCKEGKNIEEKFAHKYYDAIGVGVDFTARDLQQKAKEYDIYIQSGSMLEVDPKWPGHVFNTTCLIGPEGVLYKYRKVNTWIPYEVHTSPHDLPDYDEPLFPVAETPIGRIGCAICYDWLFPEAMRQLTANGAELLLRVSAYMDPWGATEPMAWWTIVNRCRALENIAYVVAANQGASLKHYPPYSWPGGSQVVDFDGRILAEASPGPGERIVVAPIDITALRHERETRRAHSMLAHLRTEAYPVYAKHQYPPTAAAGRTLSYERNNELIDQAKKTTEQRAASS